MCDVKGRHNLTMWGGLSQVPMHIQTQAFLGLLLSSFQGDMALVCYLRLHSWQYIVAYVEFVNILPFDRLIRCHVQQTENLLHQSTLLIKASLASSFCAIRAMHILALIMSSELYT